MDSIFFLDPQARSRFLQCSARAIGCTYICVWSYVPYPSNCLICLDAWYNEEEYRRVLFDLYRASSCSVECGCVPGLAYKGGLPYLEMEDSDLVSLSSIQVQRQFYQEAGIKKAVFLGSKNGEIEVGVTSNMSNINGHTINWLFNEDLITQLSQFPTDQSRPPLPSSSLRSPAECSSLPTSTQLMQISPLQNIRFPTPASDEEAMMHALLTVISLNNPSSSPSPREYSSSSRAFKPYSSALATKGNVRSSQRLGGQDMIKMGISILRGINLMRSEARANQESRPRGGNQLRHMISERKRREKINESFNALRTLLPPGCKKDQGSVLLGAGEYLKNLKLQISELEEKNRMLESQLTLPSDREVKSEVVDGLIERVRVQIVRSQESASQMQGITLRIAVRDAECDLQDFLLRVLECLKEMGFVSLVSVNAHTLPLQVGTFALLSLTLQVKGDDWDEQSFKEAVTRAIDGVAVARAGSAN